MVEWLPTLSVAGYPAGIGANAAILHLRHPPKGTPISRRPSARQRFLEEGWKKVGRCFVRLTAEDCDFQADAAE